MSALELLNDICKKLEPNGLAMKELKEYNPFGAFFDLDTEFEFEYIAENFSEEIDDFNKHMKVYLYGCRLDPLYKYAYLLTGMYGSELNIYGNLEDSIDLLLEEADWVRALPKDYDFSFYRNLPVYKPFSCEEAHYISLLYRVRDIILDVAPLALNRDSVDITSKLLKIEASIKEFNANILRLSEAWRYQDYDAIHYALLEIYDSLICYQNELDKIEDIIRWVRRHELFPQKPEDYYDRKFFDEVAYYKNQ